MYILGKNLLLLIELLCVSFPVYICVRVYMCVRGYVCSKTETERIG